MLLNSKNGLLNGRVTEGVASFLGIPYAKPPVGELRWRAPEPAESWEGVREATEFGASSVQPIVRVPGVTASNDGPQSEDCLFLNIWTPEYAVTERKHLPVLVIIHGGGFVTFSGAVPVLQGQEMAKKDVVVVTINYRLGPMGFFSHPELSKESVNGVSGNYGVLDQIAALRWVKENIEDFGGDPEQITVSGESAGAFCVSVLCMSPLAKGLYQRASAQSGAFMDRKTVMYQLLTLEEAEELCKEAVGNRSISELREMSAEDILQMTQPMASRCFMPIQDDWVFPVDIEKVFWEKRFQDVPLLLGSNRDDGAQFVAAAGERVDFCKIGETLAGTERLEDFLSIYPDGTKEEAVRSGIHLFSDSAFGHNMYVWSKLLEKYGQSEVFLYYYCHVPPESNMGAYHSSELAYFHRNLRVVDKKWTSVDYALQELYSEYILNFVKTGDPNGAGLERWETFRANPEEIMILDEEPHMERNPRIESMNFWNSVYK